MIYAALPVGGAHGWGVCGKYLTRELAALDRVRLLTDPFTAESVGDDLDDYVLRGLLPSDRELARLASCAEIDSPVLQCITDTRFQPYRPNPRGRPNLGYSFFEDSVLSDEALESARRNFDVLTTGSSWCTDILRGYGLQDTQTVIQGVDTSIFNPGPREYFGDRFVIFSGGKFELRKGQDLVIRAFKAIRDRHDDVLLVGAWFNQWQFSLETMHASPLIRFRMAADNYGDLMRHTLIDNGVHPDDVVLVGKRPNATMARVYRNSDIGVFPNRCEGGTNLVLMEYMACGKPAIASYSSGHRDVLSRENALLLEQLEPVTISNDQGPTAVWDEPSLDELVEQIEWAYQHRAALGPIGQQAAQDMSELTWGRAARSFHALLTQSAPEHTAVAALRS